MRKKHSKPREGMNLLDFFTLGFGAMIGIGWSVTLNNIFINSGGPLSAILGFAIATICIIPVSLAFAEMTPAMPVAGGVVVYSIRAMGKRAGFLSGWFVAMAYISLLPWEMIAMNSVVGFIFPVFSSGIKLYTLAGNDIYLNTVLFDLALVFIVTCLNNAGIQKATSFQKVLTVFLITASLLCVIALFMKSDIKNFQPVYAKVEGKSHSNIFEGIFTTLALAPFFFAGFDTIPQSVGEAGKINYKFLGKTIVISLLCAACFYLLIFFSVGISYPWQQFIELPRPSFSNLISEIYPGFIGKCLFWLSILATLSGLLTVSNSFYIASSRLLFGMAETGLLPKHFLIKNKKTGTPLVASTFCTIVMSTGPFLGIGLIEPLTVLGSTGFVVGWGMTFLSALILYKKEPQMNRPYNMPYGKTTAIIGSIVCFLMLLNCIIPGMPGYMGNLGIWILAAWVILGIIFYSFKGGLRKQCNAIELSTDASKNI